MPQADLQLVPLLLLSPIVGMCGLAWALAEPGASVAKPASQSRIEYRPASLSLGHLMRATAPFQTPLSLYMEMPSLSPCLSEMERGQGFSHL